MAATVGREPVIGCTEVSSREYDRGPRNAPPQVIHAPQLEARAADLPALVQHLAQPHSRHSVPTFHQVTVPARSSHRVTRVRRRVVGGACGSPLMRLGGGVVGWRRGVRVVGGGSSQ